MSDIAIQVQNLSKMYHIGRAQRRHDTLRDQLVDLFSTPFRRNGNQDFDETIWALKDVSFEVKHGEVLGIIGRNGAGKSTLLKILSRVTEPTSGRAVINGRVGSLLEVGTGFHPELTGRENIYLNGAILGMQRTEIERKFDEIVAFAEIEKFLDTPVKRYSSGMYVRLAFAVAAHLEPEVLLVDEVLAVGDMAFQKKCLGKMDDVAKEGRTVLLVSHNLMFVNHICNLALLIEQGAIAANGESNSVIEQYLQANRENGANKELKFDTSKRLVADGITIPLVELLSDEGFQIDTIFGGQSIRIRIHYSCENSLISPSFIVTFSTHGGFEILRLSTMPISGYYLPDLRGIGYVDCIINNLPFAGGRFDLGVGVARPNVEYIVFDKNIGSFEIQPYDAYGSGFGVDSRCGVMVTPHRWEFSQEKKTDQP